MGAIFNSSDVFRLKHAEMVKMGGFIGLDFSTFYRKKQQEFYMLLPDTSMVGVEFVRFPFNQFCQKL